jgi:hypothetical protein
MKVQRDQSSCAVGGGRAQFYQQAGIVNREKRIGRRACKTTETLVKSQMGAADRAEQ